ncbi:MAG: polysaccharide biosynthesis C-terminal domain-containing protein, partial [bacterium]|nr:polysaccharide biosynthesis C-terminal domain-containing protein [Candidatus Kapabacteria bacterium]
EWFPLVALGFLLRNYFLKVSQLDIDIRSMFLIDAAWVLATAVLVAWAWVQKTLVTADDMMIVSALSAIVSSLTGIALCARRMQLARSIHRPELRQAITFGLAQCAAAATLVVQTQGDTLLLARFASMSVVGNYDVAKKFFRGFEAIRDAGAMFAYPAVARLRAQGRTTEMVLMIEKMIGFTLVVVIPMVVIVWLAPIERIFGALYKSTFDQVPHIFRLLSLAALAIPFVLNLSVLTGLGDARAGFRSTLISSIVFVVAALLFIPRLGADGAAIAVVASYVALGIGSTIGVRRHVAFSLPGAIGRWRDAFDYAMRYWRRRTGK